MNSTVDNSQHEEKKSAKFLGFFKDSLGKYGLEMFTVAAAFSGLAMTIALAFPPIILIPAVCGALYSCAKLASSFIPSDSKNKILNVFKKIMSNKFFNVVLGVVIGALLVVCTALTGGAAFILPACVLAAGVINNIVKYATSYFRMKDINSKKEDLQHLSHSIAVARELSEFHSDNKDLAEKLGIPILKTYDVSEKNVKETGMVGKKSILSLTSQMFFGVVRLVCSAIILEPLGIAESLKSIKEVVFGAPEVQADIAANAVVRDQVLAKKEYVANTVGLGKDDLKSAQAHALTLNFVKSRMSKFEELGDESKRDLYKKLYEVAEKVVSDNQAFQKKDESFVKGLKELLQEGSHSANEGFVELLSSQKDQETKREDIIKALRAEVEKPFNDVMNNFHSPSSTAFNRSHTSQESLKM